MKAKAYHLGEPKKLAGIVRKYIYCGNRKNVLEFSDKNPGAGMWHVSPLRLVYIKNLKKFGLYFFPLLIYHYVKYASALMGFISS